MLFSSRDKRFGLAIDDASVKEIVEHITVSKDNETGGILIGHYNEGLSCAIVKKVTGAPDDSKSGRTWFYRGVKGLKSLLSTLWNVKVYYIGEWHFHPNAAPNPSSQDVMQMIAISTSSSFNCTEPILLIIGGKPTNYKIRVFVAVDKRLVECVQIKDNNNQ